MLSAGSPAICVVAASAEARPARVLLVRSDQPAMRSSTTATLSGTVVWMGFDVGWMG
jgi:hypothetical protein